MSSAQALCLDNYVLHNAMFYIEFPSNPDLWNYIVVFFVAIKYKLITMHTHKDSDN